MVYTIEVFQNIQEVDAIVVVRLYHLSLGPGPVIGSASHLLSPVAYEGKADYVFHLAGNASPHFINSDPVGIMKCNLLGTINVLEYARDCQTKKVIFASTREVYGKNEEAELLDEQAMGTLDPLDDRSCYPESKRAAETLLKSYLSPGQAPMIGAALPTGSLFARSHAHTECGNEITINERRRNFAK